MQDRGGTFSNGLSGIWHEDSKKASSRCILHAGVLRTLWIHTQIQYSYKNANFTADIYDY